MDEGPKRPILVSPKDGSLITALEEKRSPIVGLKWKNAFNGANSRIEISIGRDFAKPLLSRLFSKDYISIKANKLAGRLLFWRARHESKTQQGPWSEVFSFRVQLRKKTYLPPDGLASSKDIYIKPTAKFNADLSWAPKQNETGSLVIASTDEKFSKIEEIEFVRGRKTDLNLKNDRTYFWKVAAAEIESGPSRKKRVRRLSEYSETQTFQGIRRPHFSLGVAGGSLQLDYSQKITQNSETFPSGIGSGRTLGFFLEGEYHPLKWKSVWFRGQAWFNSILPVYRSSLDVLKRFSWRVGKSWEYEAHLGMGVAQTDDFYFLNTMGNTEFSQNLVFNLSLPFILKAFWNEKSWELSAGVNVLSDFSQLGSRLTYSPIVNLRYNFDSYWIGTLYSSYSHEFSVEAETTTGGRSQGLVSLEESMILGQVGYKF